MRRASACVAAVLLLVGCGSGAADSSSGEATDAPVPAASGDTSNAPAANAGAPASSGAGSDATQPPAPASSGSSMPSQAPSAPPPALGDPAFHARVLQMIHAVVGGDFDAEPWDALFVANVPWSGAHEWVPGTGERTADDATNGRAMGAVPDGLAAYGVAIELDMSNAASTTAWIGVTCSQSVGGAEYGKLGNVSAMEVFGTAWSDAKSILARLGPAIHGAWIVGHSAGALPALLAGLVGGAHRIDVYGVPSAVGTLDGDDGIAHLHTHQLDPAGTMGFIDPFGNAQVNPFSAAATLIKAGLSFSYHDYAKWPAPMP